MQHDQFGVSYQTKKMDDQSFYVLIQPVSGRLKTAKIDKSNLRYLYSPFLFVSSSNFVSFFLDNTSISATFHFSLHRPCILQLGLMVVVNKVWKVEIMENRNEICTADFVHKLTILMFLWAPYSKNIRSYLYSRRVTMVLILLSEWQKRWSFSILSVWN